MTMTINLWHVLLACTSVLFFVLWQLSAKDREHLKKKLGDTSEQLKSANDDVEKMGSHVQELIKLLQKRKGDVLFYVYQLEVTLGFLQAQDFDVASLRAKLDKRDDLAAEQKRLDDLVETMAKTAQYGLDGRGQRPS
jgi:hypothetical protein